MSPIIRHITRLGILSLAMLVGLAPGLRAQSSSAQGPAVVELYTSQGCSTCPPADRLLGELSAMPNVIALAFHVDYWNDGGWRDRYTLPSATDRQKRYVQTLKLSEAFTPQAVIDGRVSFNGADKPHILAALNDRRADTVAVSAEVSDGKLTVSLPDSEERHGCTVFIAAVLPQATTPVGRGENTGKTLEEFNLVRSFRSIGSWKGHAEVFHAPLQSLPPDASKIAVLIQRDGQGPILGSALVALR
jgi:hypothetical protein